MQLMERGTIRSMKIAGIAEKVEDNKPTDNRSQFWNRRKCDVNYKTYIVPLFLQYGSVARIPQIHVYVDRHPAEIERKGDGGRDKVMEG